MNDIMERLEAANPFPNHAQIERPTRSSDQLFAELAGRADDRQAPSQPQARRGVRRRVLMIAAVLATTLAITIGALVAGPGATGAQAALTQAAQAAAGFESGQADVQIVSTGAAGQLPPTAESTFTYNGDDYRFIETGKRASDGSPYVLELRQVDHLFYWSGARFPGQFVYGPADDFAYFESLETTFALDPQAAGLDSLGSLLALAGDISREIDGKTSVFTGSISRDALAQLDRSQVPPGLAMVTGPGAAELPPAADLRATVVNDVLHELEIIIDGESPSGRMTAKITTTLSGLGSTGPIPIPDDNALLDVETLSSPEDLAAAGASEEAVATFADELAIFKELAARRPRLCIEFGTAMFEGEVTTDQMAILISDFETLARCYRGAGELAAAAIIAQDGEDWATVLEEDLALEDVESRRPDLCTEHQFWPSDASRQDLLDVRAAQADCLADAGEPRAAAAVQANSINFVDSLTPPLPDE